MSTQATSPESGVQMHRHASAALSFERLQFSAALGACSPRLGRVTLSRHAAQGPAPEGNAGVVSSASSSSIVIDTPAAVTWTSRGIVPHLTRDHISQSDSAGWVHVPFESFLERSPPIPTLQHTRASEDITPLHTFLGFPPERHILSMSLRNPNDVRELPPNGDKSVSAWCIRGVKKVPPPVFRDYTLSCRPDVIVAPTDTPYTPSPFSQRRVAKNMERSAAWLVEMLKTVSSSSTKSPSLSSCSEESTHIPVLLPLAGLTVPRARLAFAAFLKETLVGREAIELGTLGYRCLDDGVWGYVLELEPLRAHYLASPSQRSCTHVSHTSDESSTDIVDKKPPEDSDCENIVSLLQASLKCLPLSKPRLVLSTHTPHEVLRLVGEVGVDLFDVSLWASDFARKGVALDFTFPAPANTFNDKSRLSTCSGGRRDIGHNIFSSSYAHDFYRLSDEFLDGNSASLSSDCKENVICHCIACSPVSVCDEGKAGSPDSYDPPHTRAYIHHLLHTHEMSAYAMLEAHNNAVVSAFFAGIRSVLSTSQKSTLAEGSQHSGISVDSFGVEVARFMTLYAPVNELLMDATKDWEDVERARGKGSMKRAREAEGKTEGTRDNNAAIGIGSGQDLAELIERTKLDAPAVLMLDPAPNVDAIEADMLSN